MILNNAKRCKHILITIPCLLLIGACSSSESTPGTELHAHVTHLPAAASVTTTGTPGKQFANNNGVTIELTSAYLTLSEMELRTDCGASPFARLLHSVYDVLVPAAHAHTESTPTKLGTPLVVNLLADDAEELEFGHFSPPPGTYCGITVHMHPADADSRDLPATVSMVGLVLHVEGSYDDGSGATAFAVDISSEPEHADIAFPAAIELSASNLTDEMHLNIEYNHWFDDIVMADLATATPAAIAQLLDNLTESVGHD